MTGEPTDRPDAIEESWTYRSPFRYPTTSRVDPTDPLCPQLGPGGARCQLGAEPNHRWHRISEPDGPGWTKHVEWQDCADHDEQCVIRHGVPIGVDPAAETAVHHALGRALYEALAVAGKASLADVDAIVARTVEVAAPLLIAEGERLASARPDQR